MAQLTSGSSVLDVVMLLWFLLTAVSLLFVAFDIRSTPESPVLKWGFVLLGPPTPACSVLCFPCWLPRAAAGLARASRRRSLAADARLDNALRR